MFIKVNFNLMYELDKIQHVLFKIDFIVVLKAIELCLFILSILFVKL